MCDRASRHPFRHPTTPALPPLPLRYCLENLQAPITQLFQAVAQRVMQLSAPGAATGPDAYRQLMPMMEALRSIQRIFYSLNYHDIPEYFEDHMGEWMPVMLSFLSYENAILQVGGGCGGGGRRLCITTVRVCRYAQAAAIDVACKGGGCESERSLRQRPTLRVGGRKALFPPLSPPSPPHAAGP